MWSDITELCTNASKELTYQEPMITIDEFSLFEAMSAVELMDPKMDQCCDMTFSIKTEDLMKVSFPENFTNTMAVQIMQSLIVEELAFLDGASYLESTHQCVFMWEGSWDSLKNREGKTLADEVILAYVKSLDRSLSHSNKGMPLSGFALRITSFEMCCFYLFLYSFLYLCCLCTCTSTLSN